MALNDIDDTEITHRNNTPWYDAKRPFFFHKCHVQSNGWFGLNQYQRCACGAMRSGRYPQWLEKNQRWGAWKHVFRILIALLVLALVILCVTFLPPLMLVLVGFVAGGFAFGLLVRHIAHIDI